MEDSTCHEMEIDLLTRFSYMECLFLALFLRSKYDFYVDPESYIELPLIENGFINIKPLFNKKSIPNQYCVPAEKA